jgi:hypothetical protein
MNMTGAKLWLASSLIATTGVAVTDTWQGWEKLGLAGVLLVFIAVLYRSSEKLREKHEADMMKREEMRSWKWRDRRRGPPTS